MRRSKTQGLLRRLSGGLLCLCMIVSEVGGAVPVTAFAAEPTAEATAAPVDTEPTATPASPESMQKSTEPPADPTGTPAPEGTEPTAKPADAPENLAESPAAPGPTAAPEPSAQTSAEPEADGEPTGTPEPIAAPSALEGALPDIYVPQAPAGVEGVTVAKTLEEAAALLPQGGTVWLTSDMEMDEVRLKAQAVTVKSYGEDGPYTLTKAGTAGGENMFSLSGGAALTLEDVVIDATANTRGRTVAASGSSTLTLGAGSVLANNTSHGAVYLDGSAIKIEGGTIRNNTAADTASTKTWPAVLPNWANDTVRYAYAVDLGEKQGLGGAILMVNGSTFAISSGEVSGNSALCGGAIYAWGGSSITLGGGSVSNNTAIGTEYAAVGGAIAVDNGKCDFKIAGAKIAENSAKHGGAFWFGIDVGPLDFTMTSGTISGNSASDGSVAYFLGADSLIEISGNGSVIEKNAATGNGALYVGMYPGNTLSGRAHFTVSGGAKFAENSAAKGSCMYFTRDKGTNGLTLDGAVFTDNKSSNDAGVLQYGVPSSTFEVRNSTFTGNRTDNRGGCFYVTTDAKYSTFTFEGATFKNNYAKQQGGVWRGFPPYTEITYTNCTFDGNKAELGDGGCFYCPGDGPESSVVIDGGEFTNNSSGSSGGAFRVNLNGGTVTVKGGALFQYNKADVNAGAFSIRRKGADYYGEAYLLECDVLDNVCNAVFDRYGESDLLPTQHYNTGGVYIGENITCYMYDALVTGNYVKTGYENNTVGSGIGLCPNAQVFLYPKHGAMIYGNGDAKTMDILAVPYDPVITHETPAMLYVSDVTPDGREYNWTNLEDGEARTGLYDWTDIRNRTESGIMTASLLDGSQGETTLEPVGFKANVPGAGIMKTAAAGDDDYKVRIIGNSSENAMYAAGGMMVNGTVIAGGFTVSVKKEVETSGVGATDEKKTNQEYKFKLSIVDLDSVGNTGSTLKVPDGKTINITSTGTPETKTVADFKLGTTTLTGGEPGNNRGVTGECTSISCEFTIKGADTVTFDKIEKDDIGIQENHSYLFLLEEIDSGGAKEVDIKGTQGSSSTVEFNFTVKNTFELGELDLTKTVTGAGDTTKLWTFDIELTEDGTKPVDGTVTCQVELWEGGKKAESFSGSLGDLSFTGGEAELTFNRGKASVQLRHGQTLKIKDLPVGVHYKVTEQGANADGYTTTPSGSTSGTITDSVVAVGFENHKEPSPEPTPTPTPPPSYHGPSTGDDNRGDLWLALFIVSGLGLCLTLSLYRKSKGRGLRQRHGNP